SNQPFDNYQDSLPIHYLIRTEGVFPSESGGTGGNDFMGEIVPFAGGFVPGGFMEAAGQILQIADYETLFQLIGTTYGGDGMTTFQLPDLRGRTIVGTSFQSPLGATGKRSRFCRTARNTAATDARPLLCPICATGPRSGPGTRAPWA